MTGQQRALFDELYGDLSPWYQQDRKICITHLVPTSITHWHNKSGHVSDFTHANGRFPIGKQLFVFERFRKVKLPLENFYEYIKQNKSINPRQKSLGLKVYSKAPWNNHKFSLHQCPWILSLWCRWNHSVCKPVLLTVERREFAFLLSVDEVDVFVFN